MLGLPPSTTSLELGFPLCWNVGFDSPESWWTSKLTFVVAHESHYPPLPWEISFFDPHLNVLLVPKSLASWI